jgi:RNA polymerase sigma-70 factor (ECF subfamily)
MMAACSSEMRSESQISVAYDEPDLIRRAQRRDVSAFELLYRQHVSRVYAISLRLTANARQAEELTQTSFLQLWKKLPLFRGECAFSSWLHRLAINTVLMDFRATDRREGRITPVADPAAFEQPGPPPPSGDRLDLEQAIAVLPPQARAVFVLHDIEGYTHEEIGRLMELKPGTSKAQLHRARQILQEALR